MDNIAFAPLVSIVHLRDCALILGIPVILFVMAPELEPFNSPRQYHFGIGLKRPPNPLLVSLLDGVKIHYRSYLLDICDFNYHVITHGSPILPLIALKYSLNVVMYLY